MPGTRCTMALCNNSLYASKNKEESRHVMFHKFPRDPIIRQQWIQRCKRDGKWNPDSCHVCSEHFQAEDYERNLSSELMTCYYRKVLKKSAIPSQKLPHHESSSTKSKRDIRQQNRLQKRIVKEVLQDTCENTSKVDIEEESPACQQIQQLEKGKQDLQLKVKNLTNKLRKAEENLQKALERSRLQKNENNSFKEVSSFLPDLNAGELQVKTEPIHTEVEEFILPDVLEKITVKTERPEEDCVFEASYESVVEENFSQETSSCLIINSDSDFDSSFNEHQTSFLDPGVCVDSKSETYSDNFLSSSSTSFELKSVQLNNSSIGIKNEECNNISDLEMEAEDSPQSNSNLVTHNTIRDDQIPKPQNKRPLKSLVKRQSPIKSHSLIKCYKCGLCSKSYDHYFQISKHVKKHIEETPFWCDQVYNNEDVLTKRLLSHCEATTYKCEHCNKAFSRKDEMTAHQCVCSTPKSIKGNLRARNREKPFKCNECDQSFSCNYHLSTKVRMQTGERSFKCNDCGQSFRKHTGEKPFKCDRCDDAFSDKRKLSTHSRAHTEERLYKCDYCNKAFSQKTYLSVHVRTHTGVRHLKCDQCEQSFSRNYDLLRHLKKHTGEKPYKCDKCDSWFRYKSNLTTHSRKHTGEKTFKCDRCDSCFSQKSHLLTHSRKHIWKKPFKCDQCDLCFGDKSNLTRHQRIHTGKKPFKCDQCYSCFSQEGHFLNHIRKHSDKTPFKCDQCDLCFEYKSNLTRHVIKHTGERPFKCDQCDSCFASKSRLMRHRRIHNGKRRFKCDQCDSRFEDKSNLTRHIRKHTREKPFKCDQCDSCFGDKGNLMRHRRIHALVRTATC